MGTLKNEELRGRKKELKSYRLKSCMQNLELVWILLGSYVFMGLLDRQTIISRFSWGRRGNIM